MKVTIHASVGRGGDNLPEDVGKIQSLLNATGLYPPLEISREADDQTVYAITEFQYRHTLEPDGRIDPDGPTLRTLNRAYKVGDMPVPDHTLIKLLGFGAFGEVWMAQTPSGVKKALKLIPLDRSSGWKEFKGVFRVRDIRNPCLVSITDVWLLDTEGKVLGKEDVDQLIKDASSSLFGRGTIAIPITKPKVLVVAMQLCDKSLYNVLEESGSKGIAKEKLLRFMEDAARGLDYLNTRQHRFSYSGSRELEGDEMVAIRHCDVKPENIMVVGGCAQVCDFGLAQIARAGGVRKRAGQLHASIYYAAPEMLEEEGVPTETTDQYSLALSYYHLRTGDLPFHPEDRHSLPALLSAHTRGRLDLSKLPVPERRVIRKATAVNPKKRYRTCGEMVRELRGLQQGPWWKDRGVAVAAAAILLSGLVGLGLLVQDRLLGPKNRLAAAVSSFDSAAMTCENLESLAENYTAVLQDHETLQTYAFVRDDVLASKRALLTKILAGAEVWLNERHDQCPAAATTLGMLLDSLVRFYTSENPDLQWDARFLQARHQLQQGRDAQEQIAWLREHHEAVPTPEEGVRSAASTKHLLLDSLELLSAGHLPTEENPQALEVAFAALTAIDGLYQRAAAEPTYLPAISGRLPWSWEESWEYGQIASRQRALFDYLRDYDTWWAQGRLTPAREALVRGLWGSAAESLLPDAHDQLETLLIDAADARRIGDHGMAIRHLLKARATVESSSADRAVALERIAAEELCIWLSFPDLFQKELTQHLSKQPPGPTEFQACDILRREGRLNPLVRALWAEYRLQDGYDTNPGSGDLPKPRTFVEAGAAADGQWYGPFIEYALSVACWHDGEPSLAAAHAMRACAKSSAAAPDSDLLGATFRRDRCREILLSAARAGMPTDASFDARLLFRPATEWFDGPLKQLEVARTLKSDAQAEAYQVVASFARAHKDRPQVPSSEWRAIADSAERVLGSDGSPEDLQSLLRLAAADARIRSLDGVESATNERLLQIVGNYASALRGLMELDLGSIEKLDSEDARILYDEIIVPARRAADVLYSRRPKGFARKDPTDTEKAMALVYRLDGFFLRKHPPSLEITGGRPHEWATEAFAALDISSEFELNADALHEEAIILAELAEPPRDRASNRVQKLSSIAKSVLDCAVTDEQKALGHHIRAYAFIAMGREESQAERDTAFEEAIAAFDEADNLVPEPGRVRAMILEGRSTARVEWAVSARPDRATWEAWLRMAARDAEAASKIPDRRSTENAFNAWGNALEDLAYYCRVDIVKHYEEALAKFHRARELGRQKGLVYDKPYLYSLVSAARCRLRRVREEALPPGVEPAVELEEAEKELTEAILWLDRMPTNDRQSLARKAEALYWEGMIHLLRPQQQLDEVAKRWVLVTDLVRGTPDWPYRQLDLIQLYAQSGKPELVTRNAEKLLALAKSERVDPRIVKEATILLLNHLEHPYDFDLSAALEGTVGDLPAALRSEVFAEKCVLAYTKEREAVLRDDFQQYSRDLNTARKGLPTESTSATNKELSLDVLRAAAKTATAEGAVQSRRAIEEVQSFLTDRPERAIPSLTAAETTLNRALALWIEVESRLMAERHVDLGSVLLETQNPRYYLVDVYIGFATVEALTKTTSAAEKQGARKKYDDLVNSLLEPLLANPKTSRQAKANQTNWNTLLTRLLPAAP